MKDRLSLREFQAQLAERLQGAARRGQTASKLGFLAGGRHWLVELDQVNEVVTASGLTPVPWAQPWFVGVLSVRGALYGCTDLAAFLGVAEPMTGGDVNVLLAHPRFGINAALRIERVLGLRGVSDMRATPMAGDDRGDASAARSESVDSGRESALTEWRDADGTVWTELSVERLMASPAFLRAGI